MFRKNKFQRDLEKKQQAYLESTKNLKMTLEEVKAQLLHTTPKEIPLNARHRLLHFFLCPNDHAVDLKTLLKHVPVREDAAYCGKLRLQLEKELRN